jgi:hypothetical protein
MTYIVTLAVGFLLGYVINDIYRDLRDNEKRWRDM